MRSIILQTAARPIEGLMILLSIIILLRGHNEPGGGFVGGLLFAAAFMLHDLAFGKDEAARLLRVPPRFLIATGVLTAALSAVPSVLLGQSFMKGVWFSLPLPGFDEAVKIGTPIIFDIGVFMTVAGVLMTMTFALEEVARGRHRSS
jgi:multicomponent Na+:H+ antiporter subunit B